MIQRLQRTLQEPGVGHGLAFAVAGALLYALSLVADGGWAGDRGAETGAETEAQVVSVSSARLAQARDVFLSKNHRAPDEEEEAAMVRHLVDQELLFRHALDLGMDRQEPVRRRLAQIASFVSETPDATRGLAGDDLEARAEEALRLGLHRDDVVVRRILVDSARRLIRGAVLTREPSAEALREHLARHPGRYQVPETIALDWRRDETDCGTSGRDAFDSLPALTPSDLERRFGRGFVAALDATRIGAWQGPLASRNGAIHVRVTAHRPEREASLEEVRDQVRREVKEQLADRWLEARLGQLRAGARIELPRDPSAHSDPLPTVARLRAEERNAS